MTGRVFFTRLTPIFYLSRMRPLVTSRKPSKRWRLKNEDNSKVFCAILFTDIAVPAGFVEYPFFLEVVELKYTDGAERPAVDVLGHVTSEKMVSLFGDEGSSYVLGRFQNGSHMNFGGKPQWGLLDEWLPVALQHAKDVVAVPEVQDREWILDYDWNDPGQV